MSAAAAGAELPVRSELLAGDGWAPSGRRSGRGRLWLGVGLASAASAIASLLLLLPALGPWLHDEIYLPANGMLFTWAFPYSLAWVGTAAVLLATFAVAILLDRAPLLRSQLAILRWALARPLWTERLLRGAGWGRAVGLRSRVVVEVAARGLAAARDAFDLAGSEVERRQSAAALEQRALALVRLRATLSARAAGAAGDPASARALVEPFATWLALDLERVDRAGRSSASGGSGGDRAPAADGAPLGHPLLTALRARLAPGPLSVPLLAAREPGLALDSLLLDLDALVRDPTTAPLRVLLARLEGRLRLLVRATSELEWLLTTGASAGMPPAVGGAAGGCPGWQPALTTEAAVAARLGRLVAIEVARRVDRVELAVAYFEAVDGITFLLDATGTDPLHGVEIVRRVAAAVAAPASLADRALLATIAARASDRHGADLAAARSDGTTILRPRDADAYHAVVRGLWRAAADPRDGRQAATIARGGDR